MTLGGKELRNLPCSLIQQSFGLSITVDCH